MNRSAFTLIEVLVGVFITTIIGGMVFVFMSNARHTGALATARSRAKQDVQIIVRHLQKDISNSKASLNAIPTLLINNAVFANTNSEVSINSIEIDIPRKNAVDDKTYFGSDIESETNDYKKVWYTRSGATLKRRAANGTGVGFKSITLSTGIKEFFSETQYDGSLKFRIVVEKKIPGTNDMLEQVDRISISVREAEKTNLDKRWRQRIGENDY